jgi:hypothetical protein
MSTKKLPKSVLKANLLAIADAEIAQEADHRARFEKLVARLKVTLEATSDPDDIHRYSLNLDFAEARNIAKWKLRMTAADFEAATSGLNTHISRVVNTHPSGLDTRDVPDWLRMRPDELRLCYELMSHARAADYIAYAGARVGYSATEIAQAKKVARSFELERREKLAAEDEARAAARTAEINEQIAMLSRQQRAYEATNPPVPDYVIKEREWQQAMENPKSFQGVEVIFEEGEFSTITPEQLQLQKEADEYYLQTSAPFMIREMEKLTEQKFDRRWKTKAELRAALRAHFKAGGYDEELDLRWLRFGEYTARQ